MTTRTTLTLAAFAIASAALPAFGQSTLKPGLWEMTNKMGGNPEIERAQAEMARQMAAMPPEQRKQMEAMMAQRGIQMGAGAGGATVVKMCMTKEMVERNEIASTERRGDCKTTRQDRSGNVMKMAWTCASPPSSGEGEFTFLGPEAYKSKMTMTSERGGKPQAMTMEGAGKWLGADCGDIKPITLPKKQ